MSEIVETKKAPELRFKEFVDEWDDFRLGELGTTQSGIGFPENEQGGCIGVPFFKVSDMNNEGNENEMISSNNYVTDEQMARRNWKPITQVPALIFAKVGAALMLNRKRLVSCPFFIDNNSMAYILGSSWIPYFGKAYFDIIKLPLYAQIGALPSYNGSDIENIEVCIPSNKKEQTKIGSFFQNLDALIALHQRKHDKLLIVKKAMLEKMFPKEGADVPEIRLKGFTGKWERKKIVDILTEAKRPMLLEDKKQYELVTVKRRNEGVVSRGMLMGKDILVKNYFTIRAGDFIISKRQIVHGANGIVPLNLDKAIVSNEYLVAVGNDNITTEFWTVISKMPDMYKKFFLSSYGVDIEKLVFDVEDWKKRIIVIPKVAEQNRITIFFKKLDDLISLHQRELDKLKNIKKACFERMFV